MKQYKLRASASVKMALAALIMLFSAVFVYYGTELFAYDERLSSLGTFLYFFPLPAFPILCALSVSKERRFSRHFENKLITPVKRLRLVLRISAAMCVVNWFLGIAARQCDFAALTFMSALATLMYAVVSYAAVMCVYMWVYYLSEKTLPRVHLLSGITAIIGVVYVLLKSVSAFGDFLFKAFAVSNPLGGNEFFGALTAIIALCFYFAAFTVFLVERKHSNVAAALEDEERRRRNACDPRYRESTYIEDRKRLFGIDTEDDTLAAELAQEDTSEDILPDDTADGDALQ